MQQIDFDTTLGRYLGRLNTAIAVALSQELQSAEVEITSDQFRLLTHLWKENGLSQNSLAERTGRDRGSVTRMLDILENKGITVRITDKNDRRMNIIYLTKKGEALQTKAVPCAQLVLDKITQGFGENEQRNFRQYLERALKNFKE